jgi:hypothetical protein
MRCRSEILLFFGLFILLLSPSVMGDKIYDGWISRYGTFEIEGKTFEVVVSEEADTVAVIQGSESVALELEECENTNRYRFCFPENRDAGWDRRMDKKIWEARIIAYTISPEIRVYFDYITDDPLPYEEVSSVITLGNYGQKSAEDFEINLVFPEKLLGISSNGSNVYVDYKSLKWRGTLLSSQKKVIYFKVKPIDSISTKITGTYSYMSIDEEITENIEKTFSTQEPIEASVDVSNPNPNLGEEIELKVLIKNNYAYNKLWIRYVNLKIPESLEVISFNPATVQRYRNEFTWKGLFQSGEERELTFKLKPITQEKKELTLNIDDISMDVYNLNYSLKLDATITPNLKDLLTEMSLSEEYVLPGDEYTLKIILNNLNDETYIKNIEFDIESELFSPIHATFPRINAKERAVIFEKKFRMPQISTNKTHEFKIEGTAVTEFGDPLRFSDSAEFEGFTSENILKVWHELDKTEVTAGESVFVSVYLKNLMDESISVSLKDSWPYEFEKNRFDVSQRVLNMAPKEKRMVYKYELTAPKRFINEIATIETVGNYRFRDEPYKINLESNITLKKPPLPELQIKRTFPETIDKGIFEEVTYTFTNNEEQELSHIILTVRSRQDMDIVSPNKITIAELSPGQEAVRTMKVRFKTNGSKKILPDDVVFFDEKGNQFETTTGGSDIKVKLGVISGPALMLRQWVLGDKAIPNETYTININLTNTGDKATDFILQRGDFLVSKTINGYESLRYYLSYKENKSGTKNFDPIDLIYYHDSIPLLTSSNHYSIEVIALGSEKNDSEEPAVVIKEVKPKEDTGSDDEALKETIKRESEQTIKQTKGFVAGLTKFIAGIFQFFFK